MQEFQKQSAQINMTVSPNQVPVQVCVLNMCQVHYFTVMILGWSEPYVSQFFTLQNEWQMEMMSDSIDDTLDDDEAEEETEELTNQVLLHYHMPVAVIRRSNQMLWMMTYGSERQLWLNLKLPTCSPRTFCWYLLAGPIYPYVLQSIGILPFWFKLMHLVAVSRINVIANLGFLYCRCLMKLE